MPAFEEELRAELCDWIKRIKWDYNRRRIDL
jgi:hypothetical protein